MTLQNPYGMTSEDLTVADYHQRSKHSLQKYARGPDGLDWDTQPNPFRQFTGSAAFALPLPARHLDVEYNHLFEAGHIEPARLDRSTLGAFFELSLGLSAWKVHGVDRWSLRVNPSSGNLHPTEAYLVFSGSNIMPGGVYHYHAYQHSLEQRCNTQPQSAAIEKALPASGFLIGLSSIHWREAWKYGERAYRYCQHDVGHAVAVLRYAAATLGWRLSLLEQCSDEQIAQLLGLDRAADFKDAEQEHPDVLLYVQIDGAPVTGSVDIDALIEAVKQGEWKGQANCLSPDNPVHWAVIDQIAEQCSKPPTSSEPAELIDYPVPMPCDTKFDASAIIRQRRSAQAFDAQSELSLTRFYRMLDALLPRAQVTPFDALPWSPRIHLVLFVHRVQGLKPGLYVFARSAAGEVLLKQKMRQQFDWSRPPVCPDFLPLYHLISANSRNASRTLSCHQSIASDGAFSVCMLAEFDEPLRDAPWRYRQLFWEAGMIGQSLYLEAEAAAVRGTGIGCYFDDAVHETLGLEDSSLQVVYHFTVGTPVLDTRLISLPPYGHLKDRD